MNTRWFEFAVITLILLFSTTLDASFYTSSESAISSLRAGISQLKESHPSRAIGSLKRAVRQNPRLFEGWYYLGRAYEKLSNKSQAVRSYDRAYQLKSRHLPSILRLSSLLTEKKTTRSDALKLAYLALQIAPSSSAVIENLGYINWKNQHVAEAKRFYLKALKSGSSRNSRAFYYLGLIYSAQGDDSTAINYFSKSLERNPDSRTHIAIADIFERREEFARALHHYRNAYKFLGSGESGVAVFLTRKIRLLGRDSQKRLFSNLKSSINDNRQRFARSSASYLPRKKASSRKSRKSYALAPVSVDTGIDFAGSYNGSYENMSSESRVSRRPSRSSYAATGSGRRVKTSELEYHLNLAQGYLRQNLLGDAKKHLGFITQNADDSYYRNQAGKLESIIRSREKISNRAGGETHMKLGIGFLQRGKLKEAENELMKARETIPTNANLYKYLAILNIRKGNNQKATDLLKKSILLDSAIEDNYILMAMILKAEGRLKAASNFSRKARKFTSDERRVHFLSRMSLELKKGLKRDEFYVD